MSCPPAARHEDKDSELTSSALSPATTQEERESLWRRKRPRSTRVIAVDWRSSSFSRNVLKPAYLARRLARLWRQRRVDLAQPAARVLHHRPVHLEARPHRRVPYGQPPQLPHHPRHVRRHHRRRPRPRPHRHPMTTPRPRQRARARFTRAVSRAGAAPVATGSGLPGRHRGVTRQALLLDVKEALVDEFVDAEGA
jgi:hypothetical protein